MTVVIARVPEKIEFVDRQFVDGNETFDAYASSYPLSVGETTAEIQALLRESLGGQALVFGVGPS